MVQRPTADEPTADISQAVWRTVAEDGIEATTVRRVAERAGCTTGRIMHHFRTRSAMLIHARELLYERTAARADAAERAIGDPQERLIEVLSGSLTLDAERGQEARVWTGFAAAALPDGDMRQTHIASTRRWRARIESLVEACAGQASTTATRHAAMRLIALTEGLAGLSSLDPDSYPPEQQTTLLREEVTLTLRALA
ncbi:TetR/AcrR family transcriptional regulator [Actinomyces slackii]|uniref:TetR family transcriptional regulator n=1 Tax=Actinomyces slackii TaxID=52774 RepID=A0A448KBY7_9ACTO|nr:TetR/AcrR family transcriptional regulator [Actinomyces slackii]VEG74443.1 TetR family transcriptional regulator [Actinomyces slackii]